MVLTSDGREPTVTNTAMRIMRRMRFFPVLTDSRSAFGGTGHGFGIAVEIPLVFHNIFFSDG